MTREEAIRLIGWLKCTTNREDDLEAIDMAIDALNNSIQMSNIQQLEAENGVLKEMVKFYMGESADAVQGEWVCKEIEYNDCDGHYAYYWYECSVCGARPPKDTWKNEWHSNFCPSCGAKMSNK